MSVPHSNHAVVGRTSGFTSPVKFTLPLMVCPVMASVSTRGLSSAPDATHDTPPESVAALFPAGTVAASAVELPSPSSHRQ